MQDAGFRIQDARSDAGGKEVVLYPASLNPVSGHCATC
jgi:hypothetical protein